MPGPRRVGEGCFVIVLFFFEWEMSWVSSCFLVLVHLEWESSGVSSGFSIVLGYKIPGNYWFLKVFLAVILNLGRSSSFLGRYLLKE